MSKENVYEMLDESILTGAEIQNRILRRHIDELEQKINVERQKYSDERKELTKENEKLKKQIADGPKENERLKVKANALRKKNMELRKKHSKLKNCIDELEEMLSVDFQNLINENKKLRRLESKLRRTKVISTTNNNLTRSLLEFGLTCDYCKHRNRRKNGCRWFFNVFHDSEICTHFLSNEEIEKIIFED